MKFIEIRWQLRLGRAFFSYRGLWLFLIITSYVFDKISHSNKPEKNRQRTGLKLLDHHYENHIYIIYIIFLHEFSKQSDKKIRCFICKSYTFYIIFKCSLLV